MPEHGRLIDADALKDRLQALADDDWNKGIPIPYADALNEVVDMLDDAPTIEPERKNSDYILRSKAEDKLKRIVIEMEEIFSDIREKNVDDSVCGLCEYDCDHGLDGYANECPGFEKNDCFKLNEKYKQEWLDFER